MSLAPTKPRTKWKWALFFGGILGVVSTLGATSPYFRFANILSHFAEPGLFLQGLITSAGLGGGGPLETWFVSIPFNIVIYTLLFYGVITGISKLSPKLVIVMGTILVIILAAMLAPKIRKFNHYRNFYGSLKQGASKREVLQELGPPSFTPACRPVLRWGDNPIPADTKSCVEELWYSSPITSEAWGIGFDEDGHAISKYHIAPP